MERTLICRHETRFHGKKNLSGMAWNLSHIGTGAFVAAHAQRDVRTLHKRKKNLPDMGARRLGNESIGFGEPTNTLSGN